MTHRNKSSIPKALRSLFRQRKARQQRLQRTHRFEMMEPRMLLAADLFSSLDEEAPFALHSEVNTFQPQSQSVLAAEGEGGIRAEGEAAQDLVAFAKALAAAGVRFYGASWCPHCKDQKELFQDGADFLPYIEVTNLDTPVTLNHVGTGANTQLNPTGQPVNAFPTWEFPDGSGGFFRPTAQADQGVLSLERLSQLSGVAIPSSDQPFIAPIRTHDADVDKDNIRDDQDDDFFNDGVPNSQDDDFDNDGIPNASDSDLDGDGTPNTQDSFNDRNIVPRGYDDDGDEIITLLGGAPLHVSLDGYDPGGGPLTYTVSVVSSSSAGLVEATLLQGNRSMMIDVAGWGKMNLMLFEQRAPLPTSRLIALAGSDYYDGVPLHRIVNGFVIQGGDGENGDGTGGSPLGDFDDQFHEDLQHTRSGVLSYAKSFDDTNDSQFFITEFETRHLDGNHSVAGVIVEGEKNREAISNNSTSNPRSVVMTSVDIFTDTENAVVMLKAAEGATGTAQIMVTARDADGNEFSRTFTVNVQPDTSNTTPWLDTLGDLTVAAGQTTNRQLQAIDIEGDAIRFGVVTPTNFTINVPNTPITPQSPAQANISITPNSGFVGEEQITFYVVDGDVDLTGVDVTLGLLQSNSSLFDFQTITVESEAAASSISGLSFHDFDRDGVLDPGEPGLAGFTIYSDANNNGQFDSGEASDTTGSDGTYSLDLSPGQHTIRQVPVTDFVQTAPTSPDFFSITLTNGQNLEDVRFGNFQVAAPTSIDLLPAADSGTSGSDNITNFNNSSTQRALQFQLTGIVDGATVRIFADGVLIHQQTASTTTGSLTVTTAGNNTLTDGQHSIVATQEVDGEQGPVSSALSVTIDTTLPADFTSTPPDNAIVDQDISYDAEGPAGVVFSLNNAPTGATIDASTGLLSWVPTLTQIGTQAFEIVATDVAGNARDQELVVQVIKQPQAAASFKITTDADPNAAGITEVMVGDTFFLHAFVTDLRSSPEGVFTFFQDVKFDALLASGTAITFNPAASNSRSGQIVSGEIDEVGAGKLDDNGLGVGPTHVYTVQFQATRSGELVLRGDAPDVLPAHDVLLLGINNAIPNDEIVFGTARLTINPSFGANDDIFNFDEDSSNNVLPVLANDSTLSGSTGTLTIVGFEPVAGESEIKGTVTIATDGKTLLYTPPADFNGEATFNYMVSDGTDTLTANVIVQVHPINDNPLAVNDAPAVSLNSSNNFLNVLANDTDIDGDSLRVQSVGQPSGNGTVTVASGGTGLIYKPGTGFAGSETFTYTITDNKGGTSQATVTVSVSGGVADSFEVDEESQGNVLNVLANDIGQGLVITAVGTPTKGGMVTIGTNGANVVYSRAAGDNFFGIDTFTYTAIGTDGKTVQATVSVTVNDTPDAPTAVDDTLLVTENTTNNVLNVLANDNNDPDPPGDVLTVVAVDGTGTLGTVSLVGGQVRYTPPATFPGGASTGTDTFKYTIEDVTGLQDEATVTVNVVEFIPSSLSGFVYFDSDNDGVRDSGEDPVANVTITLTGTDDFGQTVSRQTTTAADGSYTFGNLAPGTYKLNQTQPTGEVNGVPILDGKDTIGSQGGSVSANDEFSITLAEDVQGTGNNFAELLGRSLSGSLFHDANGDASVFGQVGRDGLLGGLEVMLFQYDANGNLSSTPFASATSQAGHLQYAGLPAGDYAIVPASTAFLVSESAANASTVTIDGSDSIGNMVTVRGRQAKYISLRDISNTAPTEYAHAAVNSAGNQWYALGRGWEGFNDANFTLMNDGATLRVQALTSGNQELEAQLSLPDPRVRVIARESGLDLIEIRTGSAGLNLQPPGASANAEGEASTHQAPSTATASMLVMPEGEGSNLGDTSNFATTSDPSSLATSLLDAAPVFSIQSAGDALDLAGASALSPTNTPAESLSQNERASVLEEITVDFGDDFRYGSSGDAVSVDAVDQALEELNEEQSESEDVPEELLEALAMGVLV